jgi:proline racemase
MTDPSAPGAHAGVIFMGADGYPATSGHALMAVATMAIERRLFYSRDLEEPEVRLVFETASGTSHVTARVEQRGSVPRVDAVSVAGVPSFVHSAGHPVNLGGRDLRVDIAFGGLFYAIVDTESVGVPLLPQRANDLRRLAVDIARAVNASRKIEHPSEPKISGVAGVIFTGPPHDPESHLHAVTVSAGGVVNRSPSGTGMSAVMSVLDAMGLLPDDQQFVQEGLVRTRFRGRLIGRTQVGELPAIVTEIEGSAWITADQTLYVDDEDPLREGVRI